MVRAWYHDGADNEHQSEPHMLYPGQYLTLQELIKETGIEYFQFEADTIDSNSEYAKLREARGYKNEDRLEINREKLPNYDEKMKMFYAEHIHADEEIRFICEGSGYFDLRSRNDKWIRIEVVKDDLVIVPAGTYHRFTLDSSEYIKVRRLFTDEPAWTPIKRPEADSHPTRIKYLQDMGVVTY
ncbi:1,2-dihydroxy-3-keto-5-methylthiopentene dioxygenase [Plakobranchus ocellatus]|uniref:Acireductone dioxygenase n=1 Tax=Plakobranchus ocellatus TaxID=259542 RepID=A0AAV4BCU6_9GAST|nr:1,2-dihydroxy-3-keto-5-methylthiopentene dioxygenase [Plakobranchus ocellatus]